MSGSQGTVLFEIVGGGAEEIGPISKLTQATIAKQAQDLPNTTGGMTMVNGRYVCSVLHQWHAANGTSVILRQSH